MTLPVELRDRWVAAACAALVLLTAAAMWLYAAAPQSVADARGRVWVAARPDAFAPHVQRAREQLSAAEDAARSRRDTVALAAFGEAAEAAWRAGQLAPDSAASLEAADLWAAAMLGAADLIRQQGTGTGLRGDDDPRLRQALDVVERVLAVRTSTTTRTRADALRARIERQLRPGPLEWLPQLR